ncbi:MAG: NAD(P)/FAD-dependent oxidoreductase [Clostridia bacterium]|nr:NAD(P)/FAD-dependent oxidoreductase [Clostridia bacterium]
MEDVIIIGGGVIGCMTMRYLSAYKLKVSLIESHSDLASGATMANSAIVHAGYDPVPGTQKAYFNVRGAELYKTVSRELDFLYKPLASLVVAFNGDEMEHVEKLYHRGLENGVPDLHIANQAELRELEPNISPEAKGALVAASAGITEPWGAAISAAENAMDNGAGLILGEKVIGIEKIGEGFVVRTDKKEYKARTVVNAAGVYSDKIHDMLLPPAFTITPRLGQYYLLDRKTVGLVNHTLFACPSKVGKGVLVSPSVHDKLLVGPDAKVVADRDLTMTDAEGLAFVRENAGRFLKDPLPMNLNIRTFAGIRPTPSTDDFMVGKTEMPGFYQAAGVESPGLASAPAIGSYLADEIARDLGAEKKSDFNPIRRPQIRLNRLSEAEKREWIGRDSRYASIVCKCEKVSEAEIVDAIHRNAGATTVKGVKKRVGAGFGRCQGGFCQPVVVNILARELGIPKDQVKYDDEGSEILVGKVK